MRKKFLSLTLALVICLGLTVPALATYTVEIEGSMFELSNEPIEKVGIQIPSEWDADGATAFTTETLYIVPDNTTIAFREVPDSILSLVVWTDLSEGFDINWFWGAENWDSEIGQPVPITPFLEVYGPDSESIFTVEAVYDASYKTIKYFGEGDAVYFAAASLLPKLEAAGCIVRDSNSSTPATPATPATSAIATPTSSPVLVNAVQTAFDAYEIGGNNYFKLRDLAYVLNGTGKQFEISWNEAENAIALTSGLPYTAVGGEMASKGEGTQTATPTTSRIFLDGTEVSLTAYHIDGNNYFKLRDVGSAFDFGVDWDAAAGIIRVDTSKGYTPD